MDQAAEPVPTQDPDIRAHSGRTLTPGGRALAERPVRAMNVIVLDVLTQAALGQLASTAAALSQALAAVTGAAPGAVTAAQHEISRSGLRLVRVTCRTRTTSDGDAKLWVARRRNIGAGEASSGLRYDEAIPADQED